MTLVADYFDVSYSYPLGKPIYFSKFYILIPSDNQINRLKNVLYIYGDPIPEKYEAIDLNVIGLGRHGHNYLEEIYAKKLKEVILERFNINWPLENITKR